MREPGRSLGVSDFKDAGGYCRIVTLYCRRPDSNTKADVAIFCWRAGYSAADSHLYSACESMKFFSFHPLESSSSQTKARRLSHPRQCRGDLGEILMHYIEVEHALDKHLYKRQLQIIYEARSIINNVHEIILVRESQLLQEYKDGALIR